MIYDAVIEELVKNYEVVDPENCVKDTESTYPQFELVMLDIEE